LGGQTGADRAALDFPLSTVSLTAAFVREPQVGGWWNTKEIQIRRNAQQRLPERTAWNVATRMEPSSSQSRRAYTRLEMTAKLADEAGKPWLHLSAKSHAADAPQLLKKFIHDNRIKILNVAGSRASRPRVSVNSLDRFWKQRCSTRAVRLIR